LRAGQLTPGRLFICLRRLPAFGPHRGVVPRPHQVAGGLLSNSGHYNRSVLNPAIRVARAGSRLWGYQPNRTSDLGNFKPAILRNFNPTLTPKDKPGDAFSAPPGLTASSKMGRTGECAPPAVACWRQRDPPAPMSPSATGTGGVGPVDHYLSGSQIAPPAARSRQIQGGPAPALLR
jgi:hypothetical protein